MKKLSILMLGALFAFLAACGSGTPEPADITIVMDEYSYTPNDIELQVGQQVTITLVNEGLLDHELMIGHNVDFNSDLQPTGFTEDFFAAGGVTPTVSGGGMLMDHSDESMAHGDDEMDMGDDESMDMSDDDSMDHSDEEMGDMATEEPMDHSDEDMGDMAAMAINMVMQPVGSDPTTITFTVTEGMVGTWEMGCFEQDGVHYTSGMTGTITVTD